MKLYQLIASGPLKNFGGCGKISSKKVFKSIESAEKFKEEFIKLCILSDFKDAKSIMDLDKVDRINIIELELEDE